MVEYFDGDGLPEPVGYRQASRTSGTSVVRIAGQVGVDAEGTRIGEPGDYAAQAERAVDNALLAFAAGGARPEHIAHLTYYVVGLDETTAGQVNRGIGRAVRRHGMQPVPATMIGITGLMRGDLLIEVNGTAVIG
ncbi:RidA family protein [Amycolatopsis circi]|uniref:RidA family protein n=1 Tax=Amycolatopsis circi TaxID=871959 RepID=UPI000E2530CD|nr:Rid family hydrolase [Amycolatopsis circi]